uniref:solute carrier family 22 member 5-like isoform X1 n=1 Tax=Styela clava TaxID=7725 RepID=UPI0019393D97|nr:solute carrier family 22 member 5-like isoform X1 [Styela clava]
MDYQDLLEDIGSFGKYQKRVSVLLLLSLVPNALPLLMFAYTQYPTRFYCSTRDIGNGSQDISHPMSLNQSFFQEQNTFNQCGVLHENNTVLCKAERIYEDDNTVIAEFGLVCENGWKVPITASLYMAGLLLAQFFSNLADRFGRRPIILVFSFLQFVMVGVVGCSWNYISYAVFVFLSGFTGIIRYVCTFVLATEFLGEKRKTEIGAMCSIAYSVGYMISPIFGYLFPYWRWYLWATSCVGILYIPLIWLLPESLRWLIVSGRIEEAKILTKKIASVNGKNADVEKVFQNLSTKEEIEEKKVSLDNFDLEKEASYLHMMKNPTLRVRSCVMYLTGFISATIYFGISLNPSQLSGNRLLNIFLSGLVEIPAILSTYFLIQRYGRSRICFLFLIVGGTSCTVVPFTKENQPILANAFVLLGKFAITGAFFMMYVVIGEITPTLVRSTSLGLASASARLGGIVMPFLFFAGQAAGEQNLPMLAMGGMALLGGYLFLRFIPETRGYPMPDSVLDAVNNKRVYGIQVCQDFTEDKSRKDQHYVA